VADAWEHGLAEKLVEARRVLVNAQPAKTEETLWWESGLAPLLEQQGGDDLRSLVEYWHVLPASRRAKVLDFVSDQVALSYAERVGPRARGEGDRS
jgi:hypothetical protein